MKALTKNILLGLSLVGISVAASATNSADGYGAAFAGIIQNGNLGNAQAFLTNVTACDCQNDPKTLAAMQQLLDIVSSLQLGISKASDSTLSNENKARVDALLKNDLFADDNSPKFEQAIRELFAQKHGYAELIKIRKSR